MNDCLSPRHNLSDAKTSIAPKNGVLNREITEKWNRQKVQDNQVWMVTCSDFRCSRVSTASSRSCQAGESYSCYASHEAEVARLVNIARKRPLTQQES
jgi:hypothetical protein